MPRSSDAASAQIPATAVDSVALARAVKGKRILVCITGGIASYKACTIVSKLAQAGASITVAMSPGATKFVQPLTLQALSAKQVLTSPWEAVATDDGQLDPQHIKLAQQAHCTVVAPCTMDCLARLAQGRGDEIVSLLLSAVDRAVAPVLLCPSMNVVMWNQPATQRNLSLLQSDGYHFEGPADGWQACRTMGTGRMSEPEAIVTRVAALLSN